MSNLHPASYNIPTMCSVKVTKTSFIINCITCFIYYFAWLCRSADVNVDGIHIPTARMGYNGSIVTLVPYGHISTDPIPTKYCGTSPTALHRIVHIIVAMNFMKTKTNLPLQKEKISIRIVSVRDYKAYIIDIQFESNYFLYCSRYAWWLCGTIAAIPVLLNW